MFILIYHGVITLVLVVILVNVWKNLRYFREPPLEGNLPDPPPLVSVLLPVRNEEHNIAECLSALLQQDYPRLEVLVLDDDSSDRTAEIAAEFADRDARIRLLKGAPLPPGWHGKAFACHQLAREARGEWLLFVDADVRPAPNAVSSSLRAALREEGDLLTYLPYLPTGTFWEKVLMPLVAFFPFFLLPMKQITEGRNPLFCMAFGPFMLFRASTYRAIGGHEAVRQQITEDMALGRLVKQHGGRVLLLDGTRVVAVRFYHNLGEIWRGLAKSAYGALDVPLVGWLGILGAGFLIFVEPNVRLLLALRNGDLGLLPFGLPLLQSGMMWLARWKVAQRLRMERWPSFLHAVMICGAIGIVLSSIAQNYLGLGTPWKGRVYTFTEEEVLVHHEIEEPPAETPVR